MPDRGKTIEDLKQLAKDDWILRFNDTDVKETAKAALALLKEQEPKPVKVVKTESDYKLYYCPRCDRPFCDFYYVKPKFCDKCGQAVKWNDI